MGKISQPLLDRIEICVETSLIGFGELSSGKRCESSEAMRKRVETVRQIQQERYQKSPYRFNSDLDAAGIREYCPLERSGKELMRNAYERLGFSARAYHRILKVARTIADMEEEKQILPRHLSEAVCYRSVDRRYWKAEEL